MERGHSGSKASRWITTACYRGHSDFNEDAMKRFREGEGWKAGVDGSVSLVTLGAGGTIDTNNMKDPIVAFVLGQKGLMYNLSLEGTKFTKQNKK
jgi:lipid-binding SYLF domain-containing protein